MRRIGFDGGSVLWELGVQSDVLAFFECIKRYVKQRDPDVDLTLLTDRLFRRYLKMEDLETARKLMDGVREEFSEVSTTDVDWASLGIDPQNTHLDFSKSSVAEVFSRFFSGFSNCVESAVSFAKDWKIYQPVRVVIVDQPWFLVEKRRPLEEYDSLEGQPFWLR